MNKIIKIVLIGLLTIPVIAIENREKEAYNKITNGDLDFLNSKEYVQKASDLANEQFGYIKTRDEEKRKKMTKEQKTQNQMFINALRGKTKNMSFKEASDYINQLYKGNDYLSKEEALLLMKQIKGLARYTKQNKEFLLYFFSESVPRRSTTNVILDVGILKENGINIKSKQYLRGPTKDFKTFVMDWKKFIDEYPVEYKAYIINAFHLKIDPRFFTTYNIKRAPAMALATCSADIPTIDNCKIRYLIRGNVSLEVFFDKISKYEKKYKQYVRYLQANKIVKKEVKNENKK